MQSFMGNWKAGFVCALIAFILVLITLFGAWFSLSGEGETMGQTAKYSVDMGLRDMTMTAEIMGVETKDTISYSDVEGGAPDVFNLTQILVILALIFTLLMFVFALLVGIGKVSGKIGMIFGALALVFVLITFVYFMVALPAEMEDDSPTGSPITGFWGSEEFDISGVTMSMSWGPGWAWYMMVIAFILALIGTIMLVGAEPAPPEPVPMMYTETPPPPMEAEMPPPPMETPPEAPP
jgi:lysylphosphatidylglycerol synthetase-like protein (DUF2156 family)